VSPCKCKWDGALDGHRVRCREHQLEYLAEKNKLTPEQIAHQGFQTEAMMWLMAGSNHVEAHLAVLRGGWEAYIAAGGRTWGKR
jgi:hypothetical protein